MIHMDFEVMITDLFTGVIQMDTWYNLPSSDQLNCDRFLFIFLHTSNYSHHCNTITLYGWLARWGAADEVPTGPTFVPFKGTFCKSFVDAEDGVHQAIARHKFFAGYVLKFRHW